MRNKYSVQFACPQDSTQAKLTRWRRLRKRFLEIETPKTPYEVALVAAFTFEDLPPKLPAKLSPDSTASQVEAAYRKQVTSFLERGTLHDDHFEFFHLLGDPCDWLTSLMSSSRVSRVGSRTKVNTYFRRLETYFSRMSGTFLPGDLGDLIRETGETLLFSLPAAKRRYYCHNSDPKQYLEECPGASVNLFTVMEAILRDFPTERDLESRIKEDYPVSFGQEWPLILNHRLRTSQ